MRRLVSAMFLGLLCGCAHQHFVFEDAAPVADLGDTQATAAPVYEDFVTRQYLIYSSFRNPAIDAMEFKRAVASEDVNSLDLVPASTWYTPRLGFKDITSTALVKAAENIGPPQKPIRVTKVKTSGTAPGFHIKDARGEKYLLKVDAGEYPGLESMTNFVVSRLFWGFGYNVPEDYSLSFLSEELEPAEGSSVTRDDIEATLFTAYQDDDGLYQATASLFLKGKVLGHISQNGTRSDDPNDKIAHENLRILRALRMFCAWFQNTGIRSDNTLDVYEGSADSGGGHTVHYLLDFGEAFGVHGLGYGRQWEGTQHFFSWAETARNFLNLGVLRKDWEKISSEEDGPEVYFEAEYFDPAKWKEVWQFEPIRKARPADDYWAAKIIASVTEAQLRALFEASGYSNQAQLDYFLETLLKRREKILNYVTRQVSAIESSGIQQGSLQLEDIARGFPGMEPVSAYKIRFYNQGNRKVAPPQTLNKTEALKVAISEELMQRAGGYLRVEVSTLRNGRPSKRPAEFHLRRTAQGGPKLVGVVH